MWFALVAAILAVAVAATVGVVAGYRTAAQQANANYGPRLEAAQSSAAAAQSRASAANNRADQLENDLAAARSSIAAYQSSAAEASAEAADVPDLLAIAQTYFDSAADVTGDSSAVMITITDDSVGRDALALSEYLSALGFSDAVLDRMSNTRALDGTLTAQGHHCNVSWTYHPDDGLQMVFEATPGS